MTEDVVIRFVAYLPLLLIAIGLPILEIRRVWLSRKVERQNAQRLADWRQACLVAKQEGRMPPFPPNRLVVR